MTTATGGIPTARSIDHFALTVPNLDSAVEFFANHLRAEVVYRTGPFSDEGTWMRDCLNVDRDATCLIAMIRLGEHTNLELFEYTAPDQSQTAPRNSDVGGTHIAVYVDDLDAAVRYLQNVEGVVLQEGPNHVTDGSEVDGVHFCYFLTPWGQQMEVISTPDGMGYEKSTTARMAPPPAAWRSSAR